MKAPVIRGLACCLLLMCGPRPTWAGPPSHHPEYVGASCGYLVHSHDYKVEKASRIERCRACATGVRTALLEEKITVCRPVAETVCERRTCTICVPVCRPVEKHFSKVEYRPRTTYRTVAIESGHWEQTCQTCGPCGPIYCNMVWVPELVAKRIPRTEWVTSYSRETIRTVACRPVSEQVTVEVKRPIFRRECDEITSHSPVNRVCVVENEVESRISEVVVQKLPRTRLVEVKLCEPPHKVCCLAFPHAGPCSPH